jgi:leucyl/phenylalanyl-tRNA--protein transferase
MFSRAPDTSKMALVALAFHLKSWGFALIDCQMANPYLMSMGAETISRAQFIKILSRYPYTPIKATWQVDPNMDLSHWEPET